jgi:hypothetical protein
MDPDACFKSIFKHLEDGEHADAHSACDALASWLRRDGFMPSSCLTSRDQLLGFIDVTRDYCEAQVNGRLPLQG